MRSRTLPSPRCSVLAFAFAFALAATTATRARAEGPPPPPPARATATATATAPPTTPAAAPELEAPIGRARELLARARLLDEAATNDEKLAAELVKAMPALRAAARAARERASRTDEAHPEHDTRLARAEELEAELAIDEIDVAVKRHAAAESRRVARELRAMAVRIAKEPPAVEALVSSPCDPPFRLGPDGRRTYRIECF